MLYQKCAILSDLFVFVFVLMNADIGKVGQDREMAIDQIFSLKIIV